MLASHEGKSIPQTTLLTFTKTGWQTISAADLFKHKTVVAFAVPGAFTSPYSPIQLLGYNEYAPIFRAHGVDEILCISVNDPFSLVAWAQAEGADQVRFIPDVTGDFTHAMGMVVDLADKGMGRRSRRYSMLVRDGTVEKMFVEPDGFETMPVVSNAETLLNYLNPDAEHPQQMTVLMHMWRTMLAV
ncbi:peroxiredoxin [Leptolyngbya iicbica]|uniref:Glutathione-dependent peroxiredoxin n=2 Tax=Cyanophyceae TaxID=3028117 RepID=A0A4Q7EFZ6_9CYAN|nr:redoxin family protein [Leptolyngbya sp. LK]RZM82521.1 peroxiredoxin [Leptolyngbya sp. LK]